ncbi:MAG TPA: DUF4129 domain-containing protein [Ferruginibacter sp.]|nr:DUF4129 domain-containing protein [Ferruginibacter sp.]
MLKLFYISVLWLTILCPAQAQEKKYVYRDSSLLQTGESRDTLTTIDVVQAPVDEAEQADENIREVLDTTLYPNSLVVPVDSVQYWKDMKAFAYVKHMDSLLKEKQAKEKKKIKRYEGPGLLDRFLSSGFVQVILWALAIFFVLFIIYKLFLAEGVFKRESKSLKQVTPQVEEEVITNDSDFDALINQAIRNKNYRQAVRYQYLKTLRKLADRDLIELSPDKTNYQYVREIKKPALQNEFASLTLNYEYVWYGEFAIEQNVYGKIEGYFSGFNQKL